MKNSNGRVLGRVLAIDETNRVAGGAGTPWAQTPNPPEGVETSPSADTAPVADTSVTRDTNVTTDSHTTADSGTSADTSPTRDFQTNPWSDTGLADM